MARSGFKMKGMSFKEDQVPLKAINLSKVASTIKSSKFGESKLGKGIGDLAEKGGKVQEKYKKFKKNIRDKFSGNDEDTREQVVQSENTSLPSNPRPGAGTDISTIEDPLPSTPMAKKSPTRNYKKGYYGVK